MALGDDDQPIATVAATTATAARSTAGQAGLWTPDSPER